MQNACGDDFFVCRHRGKNLRHFHRVQDIRNVVEFADFTLMHDRGVNNGFFKQFHIVLIVT